MTIYNLEVTQSFLGFTCLAVFVISYLFVITEEFTSLRKSKPVMLGAGLIWIMVAYLAKAHGQSDKVMGVLSELFLEYTLLFLFLLVAVTYINAIEERGVFEALKYWLIKKKLNYRKLFWISGILAFFISPIADNMTTALVMCTIILACGKEQPRFVSLSCINIVVAANAGGAFSPFGDITTLMVWQNEKLAFSQFFKLFIPSVINFLVPACIMHFAIPKGSPPPHRSKVIVAEGGLWMVMLFLITIGMTVYLNHTLGLPPAFGMMVGLALLQCKSYFVTRKDSKFNIFKKIQNIEWDTFLFFYGIILSIGGLATLGYLDIVSHYLYEQGGATLANTTIGILSSIIDNIPLMFAVLSMDPMMSEGQWLLVTLTAGVGGSILSIGSAAGVALMGQAREHYTFMSHFRWAWAILLGYFLSIGAHLWINQATFHV